MKNLFLSLIIFGGICSVTAQDVNDYKYVIVPESFDFLKEKNQYQLNALTKFLFEKHGFEVFMSKDEKPEDLKRNSCLALDANVKNESGLLKTKLVVTLEDCNDHIVFTSKEGRSKKKKYKPARHEALRDAFTSIEELNYSYRANQNEITAPTSADGTKENIQNDKIKPKEAKEAEVAKSVPDKDPVETPVKESEIVEKEARAKDQVYLKDETIFYLENTNNGYVLFQKGMAEPFASLIESENSTGYIYSSVTKQGMAYFDDDENLVIEYFDRNENKTVKTVYTLQDQ